MLVPLGTTTLRDTAMVTLWASRSRHDRSKVGGKKVRHPLVFERNCHANPCIAHLKGILASNRTHLPWARSHHVLFVVEDFASREHLAAKSPTMRLNIRRPGMVIGPDLHNHVWVCSSCALDHRSAWCRATQTIDWGNSGLAETGTGSRREH